MKPLNDYSFIRGVNHHMVRDSDELARDIKNMKKLGINSTRIWMSLQFWEKEPEQFERQLKNYVHTCWESGISTMPIIWNGNYLGDTSELMENGWDSVEKYIAAMVRTLGDEEGLLMWDVINEPACTDWINYAPDEETAASRRDQLWAFVRRLCETVRKYDKVNAITVGNVLAKYIDYTADCVDVLSFHDYQQTRKMIAAHYQLAADLSVKYGKPVLQTETGCICRADSYEMELAECYKHSMGFYLFNLYVSPRGWGDIHGLVYPDGSVRDPAAIAALFGFFRNRTPDRVLANPNREGHAYRAIRGVEDILLKGSASQHRPINHTTDEILDAAEYCVNLLEAAEMVPMWNPPSAKIMDWRLMPEEQRNKWEIERFAFEMSKLLREACNVGSLPPRPEFEPEN